MMDADSCFVEKKMIDTVSGSMRRQAVFVMVCLLWCSINVFAAEQVDTELDNDAMILVQGIIKKLYADEQFTLEDNLTFFAAKDKYASFGGPDGSSAVYMMWLMYGRVGIMDMSREDGRMDPERLPKYSFFGELMRVNREKLIITQAEYKDVDISFCPISKVYSLHKAGRETSMSAMEGECKLALINISWYKDDRFDAVDHSCFRQWLVSYSRCEKSDRVSLSLLTVNGQRLDQILGFFESTDPKRKYMRIDIKKETVESLMRKADQKSRDQK